MQLELLIILCTYVGPCRSQRVTACDMVYA